MRPRVGHIQFLNCLPLYYALVSSNSILDMELIKGTPTELNTLLINGRLDIGPISSIEYARNYDKFYLLPTLTVSSDKEVKSILLVSKVSAGELDGKNVALTNTSATSQALLKIVLKEAYCVSPTYFTCPPDLPTMLREAEAALLIGDDALRALFDSQGLLTLDLGAEWMKLTRHKMVYAVWVARRAFAEEKPHLVREVYESLCKSMAYSLENVGQIAEKASRWEVFSAKFLRDYFLSLKFSFDRDYQEGLLCFLGKARKHGFLKRVPELEFVEV